MSAIHTFRHRVYDNDLDKINVCGDKAFMKAVDNLVNEVHENVIMYMSDIFKNLPDENLLCSLRQKLKDDVQSLHDCASSRVLFVEYNVTYPRRWARTLSKLRNDCDEFVELYEKQP